ncbi:MAG: hypothetical protein ACRDHZ_08700 [Ktedonobacteraceae bacterium]
MTFDIIVETVNDLHIHLAEVPNRQNGTLVAEAIYSHFKDAPPSGIQVKYAWLRDMSDPRTPHLMDAWPERWKDIEGWQASVAAWHVSPRGISGDESEPDEAKTRQAVEPELAKCLNATLLLPLPAMSRGTCFRLVTPSFFRTSQPARP